ncbi:hypothetical protein A2307_02475 [Candidatus Peregrinibacteria bacterium RIFOXYB2_FULL_33_20]|nr:MAG: hypothetical protein A2307_02475 [Candidatus Peregrinibacteria bacterium RIFOXYB2_FULL_33_20]
MIGVLSLSNYALADTTEDTEYQTNVEDSVSKFSDVAKDKWYAGYITEEWTGVRCALTGKCAFDGNSEVNKLQAAKLIGAILNKRGIIQLSSSLGCERNYKDLQSGQWYGPYVCALTSLGIINGEGNTGNLGVSALNRITAVKVILNALGGEVFLYDLYTKIYGQSCKMPDWTDAPTSDDWYYKTAMLGACMGFISGVPHDDGTSSLDADQPVNRAQFAKMLFKAKIFNTVAFYNRDLGSSGDYHYLIVTSYSASSDANYLSNGLVLDAVEVTQATGEVSYLTAKNLTAYMLHHDLRSNSNKILRNSFGKPDYVARKKNTYLLTGSPSYLVMAVPSDAVKVKIYDYSDGSKYNVYIADKPADVSRWKQIGQNFTGVNVLDISDFQ